MQLRSLARSSWIPALVTALAAAALLLASGTTGRNLTVFFAYVLICVAFPGVLAWRLLLWRLHTSSDRPPSWLEDLSLGAIFGFGLQLPVYLVGTVIGHPRLVLALPLVALVISATPFGWRIWRLPTDKTDFRAAWAIAVATMYGVAVLAATVFPKRPMTLPANQTPSIDETFHQSLIAETSHHFPPQLPFMLNTKLDYHWFVHAQYATARWITNVDSVAMLRQLGPVLFLVLILPAIAAVAYRLTERLSVSVLAPIILVVGGFRMFGPRFNPTGFSEAFLSGRFMSSPSQAYGFMMVMPVLYLSFEVLRPDTRSSRWSWVTLLATMLALTGAKATFLPIFLVAAGAMWLFETVRLRRISWPATAFVGMVFGCTAFAQFVLFGGQSGGFELAPGRTTVTALNAFGLHHTYVLVIAMTLVLLIGWLLYGIGVLGLFRGGQWKDPRAIWLMVAVPVGVAPALLLFRTGLSQLWFQRSVAPLVVLLSVWGLACLLPKPLPRSTGWKLAGAAAASGFVAFVVNVILEKTARTHQIWVTVAIPLIIVLAFSIGWLLSKVKPAWGKPTLILFVTIMLGLGASNVYDFAYSQVVRKNHSTPQPDQLFADGGVPAAAYLRKHSSPDDIVATNAHCAQPSTPRCDNRNFWISAYTERRIVLEGWGYSAVTNRNFSPTYANRFIPSPYPERLLINDEAFQNPSAETVGQLINTYDVKWLFVDKAYPVDLPGLDALPQLISKVYENDHYVVYKVVAPPAN